MGNQEMIHWWQGYVIIKVRGKKIERLINRMMNKRFAAWDMKRTSEDEAQFAITIKDFFQLRLLLKETGCRVHVLKRVGLPFLFRKIKRRLGFFGGAIAFCLLLYMLSNVIWTVQIEGTKYPENEVILKQELAKLGVKPGAFKFKAEEPKVIQRTIMERLPEVTWVGFKFNGTIAQVKVVEKTVPEIKKGTNPRHLVAKKKAIVYDIFVEQGKPMVKQNQYVQPGDILVSGQLGTEEEPKIVSAKGKVLGEVLIHLHVQLLQEALF